MGVGSYPTLDQVTGKNINAGKVPSFIFSKPSLSTLELLTSLLHSHLPSSEEVILI